MPRGLSQAAGWLRGKRQAVFLLLFILVSVTSVALANEAKAPLTPNGVEATILNAVTFGAHSSSSHQDVKQSPAAAAQKAGGNQSVLSKSTELSMNLPPQRTGLEGSIVPGIRRLAEYDTVLDGAGIQSLMVFTAAPATPAEAQALAQDFSYTLNAFAAEDIQPIVIFEPHTSQGNVNFTQYKSGAFDQTLDAYFAKLKALGISDTDMGIWVPFPESNIPVWGNTNPTDVAACVTKTAQYIKKHFPAAHVSMLLDSKSYPKGDSWSNGSYQSLVPYVSGIPAGLIDSFGLQGFAWPDPQPNYKAADFVRPSLAIDAAKALGVKHIWLNTGTFTKGKAWNSQIITLSSAQRAYILSDIATQADSIKSAGFKVSVNLFAENKFNTPEGIDWSYWTSGKPTGQGTVMFADFFKQLKNSSIDMWLFDR